MPQYDVVDGCGQEDAQDEHGEVLYHLPHLLAAQSAIDDVLLVAMQLLLVLGIDAAIASPCRVAVHQHGKKTDGDEIEGWRHVAPDYRHGAGHEPQDRKSVLHVYSIFNGYYFDANIGQCSR